MAVPTTYMPTFSAGAPLYGTDGEGVDSLSGTSLVPYMKPSNDPNYPHLKEISSLMQYLNNQLVAYLGTPASIVGSADTGPAANKSILNVLPAGFGSLTQNVWSFLSNANVIELPDMSAVATYTGVGNTNLDAFAGILDDLSTAMSNASSAYGVTSALPVNLNTVITNLEAYSSSGGTGVSQLITDIGTLLLGSSGAPDLASEVLNLQQNQLKVMSDLIALQTFIGVTFDSSGITANTLLGKIKLPVYDYGMATSSYSDYTSSTNSVFVNMSVGTDPISSPYAMSYVNPNLTGSYASPYNTFTFDPTTLKTIYLCSPYTVSTTAISFGSTITEPMLIYNDTGRNYSFNWTSTGGQKYFTLPPLNCFIIIFDATGFNIGDETNISGTNIVASPSPPSP